MQDAIYYVLVCGKNAQAQPDSGVLPPAPPGPPQIKPPVSPPSGNKPHVNMSDVLHDVWI